jgi:hypothetical protein
MYVIANGLNRLRFEVRMVFGYDIDDDMFDFSSESKYYSEYSTKN